MKLWSRAATSFCHWRTKGGLEMVVTRGRLRHIEGPGGKRKHDHISTEAPQYTTAKEPSFPARY